MEQPPLLARERDRAADEREQRDRLREATQDLRLETLVVPAQDLVSGVDRSPGHDRVELDDARLGHGGGAQESAGHLGLGKLGRRIRLTDDPRPRVEAGDSPRQPRLTGSDPVNMS